VTALSTAGRTATRARTTAGPTTTRARIALGVVVLVAILAFTAAFVPGTITIPTAGVGSGVAPAPTYDLDAIRAGYRRH
jgi:hypothetical protein